MHHWVYMRAVRRRTSFFDVADVGTGQAVWELAHWLSVLARCAGRSELAGIDRKTIHNYLAPAIAAGSHLVGSAVEVCQKRG